MAPLAPALGIDEFVEFAGRDARMSDRWHSVEFLSVNPGGTPRKNTCLTDTLTTVPHRVAHTSKESCESRRSEADSRSSDGPDRRIDASSGPSGHALALRSWTCRGPGMTIVGA